MYTKIGLVPFASFMILTLTILIIIGLLFQPILPTKHHDSLAMALPNNTGSKFLIYQNLGFGIRIEYPHDWIVKEHVNGVEFRSPPIRLAPLGNSSYPYSPYVTLSTDSLSVSVTNLTDQNASLQGLANRLVELKRIQNPESLYTEPRKTAIAGEPGFKIQQMVEQGQAKFIEIVSMKGNRLYLIGYSYYTDRLPQTTQKMINSLQLLY